MRTEKGWPVLALENAEPLKLPPRPGLKRICPKCGILHTERRDLLECLADNSQR